MEGFLELLHVEDETTRLRNTLNKYEIKMYEVFNLPRHNFSTGAIGG